MPIYEYACKKCGAKFEAIKKFSESKATQPCTQCGEASERTIIPSKPPSAHFKGGGWAKDGYSKQGKQE